MRRGAAQLAPITLGEVLAVAELQSRVDRKYLVTPDRFDEFVRACGDTLRVLEIDGLRDFRYESVYFDTPDLKAYHQSATGRRSKFKVRTRTYVDSATCMLEVKTEGGRGETVKTRMPYPLEGREALDDEAGEFVDERVHLDGGAGELEPVLRTRYARQTPVNLAEGSRVTCDARLVCTAPGGQTARMDSHVLIEIKSLGGATTADRVLWSMGERPVPISKYCVGMAMVRPHLSANRWNRTLRRYFDWEPERAPPVGVGA
ncbi:polyphosphate polymerase domain-containing protein [Nocardioides sp. B-3]|uniref:polyphosphate polymerase domain-containing protein n=1 Tax=Nocardioides sp. B-3 TaxID=2895565 RepID=UPI002152F329|nr:polyphosphate polymerase domain-containing protein [Nocardioides sp. B-3]UUZ60089.1 polyphosphate polymerase domain-containing protein [Nocardioides sp. B-3]